ncbi:hypothetical protein BGZ83_006880 [Gryganskiella cystojenkinii]|nr:hypothetical protein BGZ83_006880 [Gryganskiella cystojenkinii]
MSRRDVTVILERLHLDHRTSLAEKACAFLDAVQAKGSIKNHPSHAAICVDIACQRLGIEVPKEALVRMSATPLQAYNAIFSTLNRILPGGPKNDDGVSSSDSVSHSSQIRGRQDSQLTDTGRYAQLRASLTSPSIKYLKQLAVQYGSMELSESVVLECLEQFFSNWFLTLPPAQQRQLNYSDPKWVGAAFWLCAMARNMNATPDDIAIATKGTSTAAAPSSLSTTPAPTKKIGGNGSAKMKQSVLMALEHKVTQKDLDATIRLIEQYAQQYLCSLKKVKGGNKSTAARSAARSSSSAAGTATTETPLSSAPNTPRRRKTASSQSTGSEFSIDMIIPVRGGEQAQKILEMKRKAAASSNPFMDENGDVNMGSSLSVSAESWSLRKPRKLDELIAPSSFQARSNKRTISNVSHMSLVSDAEDDEPMETTTTTSTTSQRPSKRTKVDSAETATENSQGSTALSSAGIMKPKKGSTRNDLKTVTANQRGQRRRAGGVYNMIPRLRYQDSKAYTHYQEWRNHIRQQLQNAAMHTHNDHFNTINNYHGMTPAAMAIPGLQPAQLQPRMTEVPSLVSQGKAHLLLWSMAEEYMDQARSLCFISTTQPNSQPGWRKRHHDLIFSAIKCLVACVSVELPSMMQLDKAKTRLRLAQILFEETESLEQSEEEVNKAILIAESIQGSAAVDIQFRLYDLQIQIYIETKKFRLAKNTLKIAAKEAAKQELHWWMYQFYLLKARVHFLTNDVAGSLNTLNQGAALAEKRGDFDLKMAFWIVAGQYSLMFSNWDYAMFYLRKLTPFMDKDHTLDMSAMDPQDQLQDQQHQQQPSRLCDSKQLRVFFLILYISCMLRCGNTDKAVAALTALHSALDETRPQDVDELQGVFKISLQSHLPPPPPAHQQQMGLPPQHAEVPFIKIKWMTFSQVYCLTYLLSGICSKADMTQPMKSQQFLIEGIKVVDREFSVDDLASTTIHVRRKQRWFSLLMMNMLLHLSDVFLLKFDLVSAEETIMKATYWSKVCGLWDVFKWRVSLSIGMIMHLGGRLEEALEWYELCRSHTASSHEDPEGYDAKSLAIVNMALVHCGNKLFDMVKVRDLLTEAKTRHASMTSTNFRCALHILDSWTKEGLIPARQHLQEALKLSSSLLNTQMRSLTLLLLGNVYLQTHDEQAEKMLMTGFIHAAKTGNQVVAAAAGSCLKDLYLRTAQGIKASQQAQQNKPVLETVDQAFQTPHLGRLLRQGQQQPSLSQSTQP